MPTPTTKKLTQAQIDRLLDFTVPMPKTVSDKTAVQAPKVDVKPKPKPTPKIDIQFPTISQTPKGIKPLASSKEQTNDANFWVNPNFFQDLKPGHQALAGAADIANLPYQWLGGIERLTRGMTGKYNAPFLESALDATNTFFPGIGLAEKSVLQAPIKTSINKLAQTANTVVTEKGLATKIGNKTYYSLGDIPPSVEQIANSVKVEGEIPKKTFTKNQLIKEAYKNSKVADRSLKSDFDKYISNFSPSFKAELPEGTQLNSFFDLDRLKKYLPGKQSSSFKSEIDWAKWNEEIPNNAPLMKEYNAIEETSKANGTWMKNLDGSAFQGTPEQFVQQNSSNFKKAFGESKLINPDGSPMFLYHGSAKKFDTFDPSKFQLGDAGYSGAGIYTIPSKTTANSYAISSAKFHSGDIEPTVYQLYGQGNRPIKSSDLIKENQGRDLFNFHRDRNWKGELSPYESLREYDVAVSDQLPNVQNIRPLHDAREIVFPKNTQVKSAVGNNGMFDMSNPNIYKALIPTIMGGATGTLGLKTLQPEDKQRFEDGGQLPQYGDGGKINETAFKDWYSKVSKYKNLDPNPDSPLHYYDYRLFFEREPELAQKLLSGNPEAHFTDIGKRPGHPTFSNESYYYKPGMKAVRWEGENPIPIQPTSNGQIYEQPINVGNKTYNDPNMKYGGHLPKFEDSGSLPNFVTSTPTRSDSLMLYNNAIKVDSFYNNSGKYKKETPIKNKKQAIEIHKYAIKNYEDMKKNPQNHKGLLFPPEEIEENLKFHREHLNSLINNTPIPVHTENEMILNKFDSEQERHLIKNGVSTYGKLPVSEYRQDINENQYYQRENQIGALNLDAPMQLFDRRIEPTNRTQYYLNDDKSDHQDGALLYQYDPILIKPFDLLTPEEKVIRQKKLIEIEKNNSTTKSIQKQTTEQLTPIKPYLKSKSQFNIPAGRQPTNPSDNRTYSYTTQDSRGKVSKELFDEMVKVAPYMNKSEGNNEGGAVFNMTDETFKNYLEQKPGYVKPYSQTKTENKKAEIGEYLQKQRELLNSKKQEIIGNMKKRVSR